MSERRLLYSAKVVLQWTLIYLLCYMAFLAIRDSDKLTFEMRAKESLTFIEHNHPGYRLWVFESLGIDRKNCTEFTLSNQKEQASVLVTCWG